MSNAQKVIDENGQDWVVVNGRRRWMRAIESIERKSSYEFLVKHRNLADKFVVWGGKKSGGGRGEWFVDWPTGGSAKCSSLMDGLNLINGM